jgi:hypothetical protein
MHPIARVASAPFLLALLASADAAADRLYRWVDADGRVHYTDQLPPPTARNAERKRLGDKPPEQGLPYAVQEAKRKFPVAVYTAEDCGDPCKEAIAYLAKRGVPHARKDARDPAAGEALMKLTGGKLEVPVATVGSTVLRGYEEGAWGRALDAAGYPRSAVLPPAATTSPGPVAAKPNAPATPPAPAPAQDEGEGETETN